MKWSSGAPIILVFGLLLHTPVWGQSLPEVEVNLDVLSDIPAVQKSAPVTPESRRVETAPLPPASPKGPVLTAPILKPKAAPVTPPSRINVARPSVQSPAAPIAKKIETPVPARKPTVADIPVVAPSKPAATEEKKSSVASSPALAVTQEAAPTPAESPPSHPRSVPAVPSKSDLTLTFAGASADLNIDTQQKLDAIIRQMIDAPAMRLQLRSYAAGPDGTKSDARRLSLSRALSVREFLMSHGIDSTRVDVRALGSETDTQPLDRVDAVFVR